ncbi:translocation/assembly module TamB domain-containing protein [Loktanella agnita]
MAPGFALAQSQEDEDKGYLTGLIEDNLSGVSREVSIIGFSGALSSSATIQVLTVADEEGVWLTLEDIVLDWNRSALFRGAIDIDEISAAKIIVARAPIAEDTGPAPEATPFSLPELPVSVSLGQLQVDEIELGESFLGEPVSITLSGTAELSGGEGAANVVAERLGDKTGIFEIDGSYSNATRELGLLLNLEEGPDGIAARILDLPGRPAVGLQIDGTAPIDDYAADLAISTDGTDRLNGRFALNSSGDRTEIMLDVGGDVSPLFVPEYKGFFGTDARLFVRAFRSDDGRIDIPALELEAERLNLDGAIQIGAQGWPELIDLTGGIVATGGDAVLLPLSGPKTYVDGASLVINYNSAQSDDWRADIEITNFERPGLRIDTLNLTGGGVLRSGEGSATGLFTAGLNYGATGLQLDDAGAAEAFGDTISGAFAASRTEGEPTEISRFTLSGAGLDAQVTATIDGPDSGFQTDATADIKVAGLGRFATLVGRDLSGDADARVAAQIAPLDGLFSIALTGETDDLALGIPRLDPVIAGRGTVAGNISRDETGTRIDALRIATANAQVTGSAVLSSDGAQAELVADLRDVSMVEPTLTGAATATIDVTQNAEGIIDFSAAGTGPAAGFDAAGTVSPAETGQTINLRANANVSDLTQYADLVGQPLSGAADLSVRGVLLSDSLRFDLDIDAETQNLTTGIARVDPLIGGNGRFSGGFARTGEDSVQISGLDLQTPALSLRGDASLQLGGSNTADIDLLINDTAVLDPSLSGPLTLRIDAEPAPDNATAARVVANGPGVDLAADVTIASPAQDYEIAGDIQAAIAELSNYATLIGQNVGGSVELVASGSVLPDLSRFDTQLRLRSEDLKIGNATVDPLLRGTGRINATVGLADGVLSLRTLEASTPEFSIVGALNGNAGYGEGRFNASLRDVGLLTDQISGPVRATGTASLDENGNWGVDATGTGPGGMRADIAGQVSQSGRMDIDINGSAPLGLANAAIDPRRLSGTANFDLSVNGPPALSSVNGQITFANGRLSAPSLAQTLTDIDGQIRLSSGSAQINLRSQVQGGGGITASGPVSLSGAYQADIQVQLDDVVLSDPNLYSTSVGGSIRLNGPLQGGARIRGRLELGEANIQVPSSSISSLGELPDVVHLNASAAVRRTLQRADAAGGGNGSSGGGGGGSSAFPLDIVINAPSRIFIRGRGLDAELGGRLTIGGTTADVIPVGRFELIRGRIDILQQRFELTEGSASLQGDFDPYIRLVATTTTDTGTVVSIIVEGPADAPEVRFESIPQLPQDEVLAQLIFGRDLESISPLQAVQLAAAISTLAGRGGGAIDRLRENIGLDDFDVTTDEEGAAAVRAGKYLSDNVYTDVTVTSEGNTEINLNLDLTREITAKGSVDQDGATSVGVFFERDY